MFQSTHRLNRVAVVGTIAVGMAVGLSSFGIVRADYARQDASKTYTCSRGQACVEGLSTGSNTWSVYGLSESSDGVHGVTSTIKGDSAVAGISTGTIGSGHGVYGKSSNGPGVYGDTTAPGNAGVMGVALNTGSTGDWPALQVVGTSTKTWLFGVWNTANYNGTGHYDNCSIDSTADLYCTGTITGYSDLRTRQATSTGQHVLAYAPKAASETMEDVGTGQMVDGVANVHFEPDFASTIDRNTWYYVFLTPLGDTRGLYVSRKAAAGFQVRETEHGRSTLEFDYRIDENATETHESDALAQGQHDMHGASR